MSSIKKFALLAIFLLLVGGVYFFFFTKPAVIEVGPVLNQKAPEIHVIDTRKSPINIEQLSGEKGLILVFFRSADWCPFCKRHLIELNDYAQQFNDLGYGIGAISYDSPEVLAAFTQEENLSYPLLADQQVKTMQAYGIVNSQYSPGDENYGIPYPGIVIVNKAGEVVFKYFYEGYMRRVKFDELYQQLELANK